MLSYAPPMARATGKKKKKPEKAGSGEKGRPRTVRLPHEDERWVDGQPGGDFTAVIVAAVQFYREHMDTDTQRQQLLEAVS